MWLQNHIKFFEFDYALDICPDHITFDIFYIFGRWSLTLMWVLFFLFNYFFRIVVLLSFINFVDMFLGVLDCKVAKIGFEKVYLKLKK